ncbi:MAG: SBBP repeat-containing protein [Verrucomicrobiae bacterium]|nr:SBBP repeat-containing protein [Verrucomicrobiae bacterium]
MKSIRFTLTPVITLVLALLTTAVYAQNSWTNRYSGAGQNLDGATAMAVDNDGNVLVTGMSWSDSSSFDYATIKYSNAGVPLWTNRYNGPGNSSDVAMAIAVDSGGNVFVTGRSEGAGSSDDFATIKYSSTGTPVWTNRYNGPGNGTDTATAIAVDNQGNVFVTGYSVGVGIISDYLTIKYSNAGAVLWMKRSDELSIGNASAMALAVDDAGNVFVTGYARAGGPAHDYMTLKYSSTGALLWTNRYNGPGNGSDMPSAIAVDHSGNVLVTGYSKGGGTGQDFATIKYSNAGIPLWTNRYNGPGNYDDGAMALAVDRNDNVIVAGYSFDIVSMDDYATVKYSNGGVPLWTNRYSGPGDNYDRANAIAVDVNDNVYVTGSSWGSAAEFEYATLKYSSAGAILATHLYRGPGNADNQAAAIAVDSSGNVFVTGSSSGNRSGQDYATIKYAAAPLPPVTLLKNPQVSAGQFSFILSAEVGGQFALQVSTNLVNWGVVRQVTIPASGSTNIVEPLSSGAGQKYYRAQRQ